MLTNSTSPLVLDTFVKCATLLVVLLNPFLMTIYLVGLVEKLDGRTFRSVLVRGGVIATAVFVLFATSGDAVFREVLQVRFAAFLIFGGILFLVIGVRFAISGPGMLAELRGDPRTLATTIAMPFMIGPGTVSASIYAGARLPLSLAIFAIVIAVGVTVGVVVLFKLVHDHGRRRAVDLVDRWIDLVGRISALVVGTIAIEMILRGVDLWLGRAT